MPSEYVGKLYKRILGKFINYYQDEDEEFNKKVKQKNKTLWALNGSNQYAWASWLPVKSILKIAQSCIA